MITNVGTLKRVKLGPVVLDLSAYNDRKRFNVAGAKSGRVQVMQRGPTAAAGTLYVRRVVPGGVAQAFATPKTASVLGASVELSTDDLRGEEAIEVGWEAPGGVPLTAQYVEVTVALDVDVTPVGTVTEAGGPGAGGGGGGGGIVLGGGDGADGAGDGTGVGGGIVEG